MIPGVSDEIWPMQLAERWRTDTRVLGTLAAEGLLFPCRMHAGYIPFLKFVTVEYIEAQWPALRTKVAGMTGPQRAKFTEDLAERVAAASLGGGRVERAWLIALRLRRV